jgi:tetratricopeptide (TPR) repeat protein
MALTFRQKLILMLAVWYDLSQKEIEALARMPPKGLSEVLRRQRGSEIKDELLERVLAAMKCSPAAASVVTGCLESLAALEAESGLTAEEKDEIEAEVLALSRLCRETLIEATRLSRSVPAEGYPEPHELDAARWRAEELFSRLKDEPETTRSAVVRVVEECQTWAMCEQACHASERAASRDLKAAAWARLAQEIAERVRGPEPWRRRVQGYAAAFAANVVRVQGDDLEAADAAFAEAKRLWESGADPAGVLDPGRLLDLEASLRRDQRRFDEALDLLRQAEAVGHNPARALIKQGSTLEVMGDYEAAVEALSRAAPRLDRQADAQLWYSHRFNLQSVANREGDSCLIFHDEPDNKNLYYLGWCHGPVGTARLFVQLHRIDGKAGWLDWARRGAKGILASGIPEHQTPGFWNNAGQCCGSAGVASFFLDFARLTGDESYLAFARRVTGNLLARATATPGGGLKWIHAEHRVRPEYTYAQTGYMQGAAGIGMLLLQMDAVEKGKEWTFRLPDSPY